MLHFPVDASQVIDAVDFVPLGEEAYLQVYVHVFALSPEGVQDTSALSIADTVDSLHSMKEKVKGRSSIKICKYLRLQVRETEDGLYSPLVPSHFSFSVLELIEHV